MDMTTKTGIDLRCRVEDLGDLSDAYWHLEDGRVLLDATPDAARAALGCPARFDDAVLIALAAVCTGTPAGSEVGATVPEEAVAALWSIAQIPGRWVSYHAEHGRFWVHASDAPGQGLLAARIAASQRDRRSGAYWVAGEHAAAQDLVDAVADEGWGWSGDARRALAELAVVARRRRARAQATRPDDLAELEIPGLAVPLMAYQLAGVQYLLDAKRALLGDQMGLGKGATALATVASAHAWPAVVVCPAALRTNWVREVNKFFPGRLAVQITSTKPHTLDGADVVVISYDLLSTQLGALRALKPGAVICDESHYVKDAKTKRAKAAKTLAKAVPADGLVLCLSGTPVVNRPFELVGQLEVLGRLGELGGFWHFVKRWCNAQEKRWGWDFSGASNSEELLERMRGSFYLRRRKTEVLKDLPPKRRERVVVDVDLDTKVTLHTAEGEEYTTTYRALEEDFVGAMVARAVEIATRNDEDVTSAAVAAELRAETREHFGKVQDLHYAIGMTKVPAVIEWAQHFLEEGAEDNAKLIIFAHHRKVLEAIHDGLVEHGAELVWGGQSPKARQSIIDGFQQRPAKRVLVCSIKAAGVGLTLTAASDVLFAQPIWTVAEMSQAEDRVHRIGQRAGHVTVWEMVAADTADERIYALLDTKAEVVDAVVDGADQGILGEFIVSMARTRRR